jgi:hypothetical protein
MLGIGSKVCVRTNPEENVYFEGQMVAKRVHQIGYRVRTKDNKFDDWVSRAVLRELCEKAKTVVAMELVQKLDWK